MRRGLTLINYISGYILYLEPPYIFIGNRGEIEFCELSEAYSLLVARMSYLAN